ncbi:unnamed protein product, partial [Allacma fusca]
LVAKQAKTLERLRPKLSHDQPGLDFSSLWVECIVI